jgi:hypothetical protein
MDNIATSDSYFESNNQVKILIGDNLDRYGRLSLYYPFKEKKPPHKELTTKMIKKIEKKESQPFLMYLKIYDSSELLFDSEHEVKVDGNCTIAEITRMCLKEEVASKIHVRH